MVQRYKSFIRIRKGLSHFLIKSYKTSTFLAENGPGCMELSDFAGIFAIGKQR